MKKLTLLLGALVIAGATFAGDGKKDEKACCKKGEKKEACCKKGEKSCKKDEMAKKETKETKTETTTKKS